MAAYGLLAGIFPPRKGYFGRDLVRYCDLPDMYSVGKKASRGKRRISSVLAGGMVGTWASRTGGSAGGGERREGAWYVGLRGQRVSIFL